MGLPVGPDHAIDAELSIIWEAAEVPSIRPVLHSPACTLVRGLIHSYRHGQHATSGYACMLSNLNRESGRLPPSHVLAMTMIVELDARWQDMKWVHLKLPIWTKVCLWVDA